MIEQETLDYTGWIICVHPGGVIMIGYEYKKMDFGRCIIRHTKIVNTSFSNTQSANTLVNSQTSLQ